MSAQTESSGTAPSGAPPRGWDQGSGRGGDEAPPAGHPAAAIRDAVGKLRELREFAAYYLAARADAIKASVRNAGIYAALGIVGALAAGTLVVMAIALLLIGIARGLGALLGGREWLGDIITGAIFLALLAAAVVFGMKMLTRSFKSQTVRKYEQRQSQQQQQFGRDVRHEASAAGRSSGEAH